MSEDINNTLETRKAQREVLRLYHFYLKHCFPKDPKTDRLKTLVSSDTPMTAVQATEELEKFKPKGAVIIFFDEDKATINEIGAEIELNRLFYYFKKFAQNHIIRNIMFGEKGKKPQ